MTHSLVPNRDVSVLQLSMLLPDRSYMRRTWTGEDLTGSRKTGVSARACLLKARMCHRSTFNIRIQSPNCELPSYLSPIFVWSHLCILPSRLTPHARDASSGVSSAAVYGGERGAAMPPPHRCGWPPTAARRRPGLHRPEVRCLHTQTAPLSTTLVAPQLCSSQSSRCPCVPLTCVPC